VETADPVGLITTTVELAAALLLLSPAPRSVGATASHERWITVAAVPLALLSLLGTTAIAGVAGASTVTTSTGSAATSAAPHGIGSSVPTTAPSMPGMATGSTTTGSRATGSRATGSKTTGGKAAPLALATTSPAGPIQWPDDMAAMAPGMEMATPDCGAEPTAGEQSAAVTLVDQTVAAVAPYKSLAAAEAAGYVPLTRTGQKIVHYINPSIYRQGHVLDPSAIPVLVYVNTAHGAVLSAAMYLMPRSAGGSPPQPGGCLTQWHIHTDLCFSGDTVVGNDNAGSCATGINQVTEPMMHVWVTPVSGGPLAPDPSAVSEVKGADAVPGLDPPNASA
jgi:hypothetical protein